MTTDPKAQLQVSTDFKQVMFNLFDRDDMPAEVGIEVRNKVVDYLGGLIGEKVAPLPDEIMCVSCGRLGKRPEPPFLSCCPERRTVSIRAHIAALTEKCTKLEAELNERLCDDDEREMNEQHIEELTTKNTALEAENKRLREPTAEMIEAGHLEMPVQTKTWFEDGMIHCEMLPRHERVDPAKVYKAMIKAALAQTGGV